MPTLIKCLIFGYWISIKINLIPRLHFERDILSVVGVLPFSELYHSCFVIISTVQLKIFSMLMLKSAMIRIFKKFGLLVVLSYPCFHCQRIKKKRKTVTWLAATPTWAPAQPVWPVFSSDSDWITDAVLSLRLTFIIHLRPEVLILHVCSRVATYSNIIIHFNWKANKRDTYGTICSNTVHEAVMRLSVVSNVTLHSLAFLFGSNWTGRIISFYENIKIKTWVPTCLGGHKPCSTSPVNDIPGQS